MTATLPVSELFGPTLQGEGPAAGRPAWFLRLMGCNLSCQWCMVPGMMILRPDFTWTPVEHLRIGDKVLGRTAPEQGKHGRLVESTVTHTTRREAPLVRVNGNLTCAADTRFWTSRNRSARSGWRNIERCEGLDCTFLAEPMKRDVSEYQRGYLAGMADGDGTFWTMRKGNQEYRRFRLALNDRALLRRVQEFATAAGYTLRDGTHRHTGFNGPGSMPCLWLTDSVAAVFFEQMVARTPDSESWAWGYLAGIFDAEGHLTAEGILRIAQHRDVNGPTYERIAATAERLGFDVAREERAIRIRTRGGELWRFLVGATPAKATSLAHAINRAPNNARTIHRVEEAGFGEVVSLTTSTGNYIAEGWLVHNCDTPYTWDQTRFDLRAETTHRTAADIDTHVTGTAGILVLTGGEPLRHQHNPAYTDVFTRFDDRGWAVHVETNGTLAPTDVTLAADLIVVSPKLGNAGPHRGHQNPTLHPAWRHAAQDTEVHLKVVCGTADDVAAAAHLALAYGFHPHRTWVMPRGATPDELATTWPTVADAAITHGLCASHRLHTLAWGTERGR